MDITTITVSVNYSDYLKYSIINNLNYFKNWIIVTDRNDYKTINLCKDYSINFLFYNFYKDNLSFNKGGAIKYAQEYAYNNYPNDWFLILDSDICLPYNFNDITSNFNFQNNILYCAKRKFFPKLKHFIEKNPIDREDQYDFLGFFQFYKSTDKYYRDSKSCEEVDLIFAELFNEKMYIPDLVVDHLGLDGKNWYGRKSGEFYEI